MTSLKAYTLRNAGGLHAFAIAGPLFRKIQTGIHQFLILAGATLVALLITAPAIITLVDPAQPPPFSISPMSPKAFAVSFVAGNLVVGLLVIALGLWLEPRVGLGTPLLRAWLQREPEFPKTARAVVLVSAVWVVEWHTSVSHISSNQYSDHEIANDAISVRHIN